MSGVVCVTGASGFIASQLVQQLLATGYSVRGTVRHLDAENVAFLQKLPGAGAALELVRSDLTQPGSFDGAVEGSTVVFHTASPYVLHVDDPQRDLVEPAVQGTVNVLRSCLRTKHVERVVLTSSIAAITDEPGNHTLSEADWNTKSTLSRNPYFYSKTLAERTAWHFVQEHKPRFRLVVINPFFVVGPSVTPALNSTNAVLTDILKGAFPGIVDLAWGIVDVRDVARAHVLAMEVPDASGRYICAGEVASVRDVVQWMREAGFSGPPYKLPSFSLDNSVGNVLVKLFSYARPSGVGSYLRSHVGRTLRYENSRIRRELGLEFRPARKSIRETLLDLEKWGHVPRRAG